MELERAGETICGEVRGEHVEVVGKNNPQGIIDKSD